jgi:hypothetical protein
VSDTENAYIIRRTGGEAQIITLNLNYMLYDSSYYSDQFVQNYDTLMIPFKQYFINVAGAVQIPGRYPYIPDRSWEYYIGLAGGFDESKNSFEKITIVDIDGNKLEKTDAITPECTITAETNDWSFYISKYTPLVTSILTLVSTVLSIFAITQVGQ